MMSIRIAITTRAAMARWKYRIINALLGPAARAGQLVADADARLVGLFPRRPPRPPTSKPDTAWVRQEAVL